VEFYGEAQSVANAPTGDAFGFVGISGSGVKTAWQPLIIRADLNVENGATFVNNSRGTGMRVEGSLRNAGLFLNNGVLEIGKP
jgi:ABC-type glutathione transport system ATPase component